MKGPRAGKEPGPAQRAAELRARWGSERPALAPPPAAGPAPAAAGERRGVAGAAYIRRGAGAALLSFAAATRVGAPGPRSGSGTSRIVLRKWQTSPTWGKSTASIRPS